MCSQGSRDGLQARMLRKESHFLVNQCVAAMLTLIVPRQIDSAKAYHNEAECGEAIRKSGLKRSEVFFTTKVPWRSLGYEPTREAIESSLKEANVDYFDL